MEAPSYMLYWLHLAHVLILPCNRCSLKAPAISRDVGKGIFLFQFWSNFVCLVIHRLIVYRSTGPQPSARQDKHVTDVKQLFPDMSAKRPESDTLYFFLWSTITFSQLMNYGCDCVSPSNTVKVTWHSEDHAVLLLAHSNSSICRQSHPSFCPPPSSLAHLLTITEMWRICICSSTISEGSCSVGAVAWASCPELLMEIWKYSVPFSSHCCLQCTREMSAAVPDISARQDRKLQVSYMPGFCALGQSCFTQPWLQKTIIMSRCFYLHHLGSRSHDFHLYMGNCGQDTPHETGLELPLDLGVSAALFPRPHVWKSNFSPRVEWN